MITRDGSHLRDRIVAGPCLGLAWLALGDTATAEIAAASGADALVVDLQHGLWSRRGLEAAVAAARLPVIVRIGENTPLAVSTALDSGADAVLVPLVETAEAAAAAVAAARFPPEGIRSGGGVRPLAMGFTGYLEAARGIAVGVMIETRRGVEVAEAIAAVPGLDFILIGTGDLGLSLAGEADPDAARERACRTVLESCRRAGIACGIFTTSVAAARARRGEGYTLVVIANDIDVIRSGFGDAADTFARRDGDSA